jgi:hypothetical protein
MNSGFLTFYLFVVWDLKNDRLTERISVQRPPEDQLFKYKNVGGEEADLKLPDIITTPG